MKKEYRKEIRREKRIAARVTEELFEAINKNAFEKHRTVSSFIVDVLIEHLNFKPSKKPVLTGKK